MHGGGKMGGEREVRRHPIIAAASLTLRTPSTKQVGGDRHDGAAEAVGAGGGADKAEGCMVQ